ncbi:MAG: response regulator [Candidatus Omnitrophota bacterium]|nr:response regulator [Candidatus Omnitrophota bacterium]
MANAKILIVDDKDTKRAIYREMLERDGYTVVEARDGEEGIKKAMTESPDVIITDIVMPRIDGFKMIETIKTNEIMRYIPVICVSATYKDIESKLKVLTEIGAEEYFYIPENIEELLIKVKVMLRIRKIYLELLEKNNQLKIFNASAVNRELKMIELKDKVKKLEEELSKYKK